jgi:hypothetical protein
LQGRLERRLTQLDAEAQISALAPAILGAVLVVPIGLISLMRGVPTPRTEAEADKQAIAAKARAIVMHIERDLGFEPIDREVEQLGYDIESRVPNTGKLRFIEVKGRKADSATVTVTKNEILYSLNSPEDFILAVVELDGDKHRVHYVRKPFGAEPDFGVTSVNYDLAELLKRGAQPS